MNEKKKQVNIGEYRFEIGDLVRDIYNTDVGIVIDRYESLYGYGPTYKVHLQSSTLYEGIYKVVEIREMALILISRVKSNEQD